MKKKINWVKIINSDEILFTIIITFLSRIRFFLTFFSWVIYLILTYQGVMHLAPDPDGKSMLISTGLIFGFVGIIALTICINDSYSGCRMEITNWAYIHKKI